MMKEKFSYGINKLTSMMRRIWISLFLRTKIQDFRDIPIIINNRNRFDYLIKLIHALESRGYRNIIILDNASTYPPLIDYYKTCPHQVIQLNQNLGYMALEKCDLYNIVKKDFFVYTDPDVVPVDECPFDFLDYFWNIIKKDFFLEKIGFSLKIDDLPDCYDKKEEVIKWEKKYFEKEVIPGVYKAPIDTTFALHKPYAHISLKGAYNNYRTGFPYEARHLPWYENSSNMSEESIFYKENATIGGHWTNGIL